MSVQDDEITDEFATVTEVRRVWWPGDLYVHGEQLMDPADFWRDLGCTQVIPDHPALIPVARWLATEGDTLDDLLEAAVFCLDEGGEIIYDDPAHQMRVIAAGRALIAALEEGTR